MHIRNRESVNFRTCGTAAILQGCRKISSYSEKLKRFDLDLIVTSVVHNYSGCHHCHTWTKLQLARHSQTRSVSKKKRVLEPAKKPLFALRNYGATPTSLSNCSAFGWQEQNSVLNKSVKAGSFRSHVVFFDSMLSEKKTNYCSSATLHAFCVREIEKKNLFRLWLLEHDCSVFFPSDLIVTLFVPSPVSPCHRYHHYYIRTVITCTVTTVTTLTENCSKYFFVCFWVLWRTVLPQSTKVVKSKGYFIAR